MDLSRDKKNKEPRKRSGHGGLIPTIPTATKGLDAEGGPSIQSDVTLRFRIANKKKLGFQTGLETITSATGHFCSEMPNSLC